MKLFILINFILNDKMTNCSSFKIIFTHISFKYDFEPLDTISQFINKIQTIVKNRIPMLENMNLELTNCNEYGEAIEHSDLIVANIFNTNDFFYIRPVEIISQLKNNLHALNRLYLSEQSQSLCPLIECGICFNYYQTMHSISNCSHSICQNCYLVCIQREIRPCPFCRQGIIA